MLRFIRWLFCVLAVTAPSFAVIERTVDRHFSTGASPEVSVATFYGGIKVRSSANNEVRLVVHESFDAKDEAEVERVARELAIKITDEAGRVALAAEFGHGVHWSWSKWPPVGLSFEIFVPASARLELKTKQGDVDLGGLGGSVAVETSVGNIIAGELDGDADLHAERGDVTVTACAGALRVRAGNGNILIGRTGATADLSGVGGTIDVQTVHGALRLRGDGTDAKVGFAYPLSGDAEVSVNGGDLSATFETRVAATVDARASTFGHVDARELDWKIVEGAPGKSHVVAELGGGGRKILLRARGGNIQLRGVPPIP